MNDKYKETIRLFDRCVEVRSDSKECNARFGVLLAYMRENFETPPKPNETGYKEVLDHARTVLQNSLDIAGIRGIPPNVSDFVYPIAIVMLCLQSGYNLPIDPAQIGKEFGLFRDNYGDVVINSLTPL